MREKWEKLCKQLIKMDSAVDDFLQHGELSSISLSRSKGFVKELNALKKNVADFDTYISPVDSLEIEFPFKSPEMVEIWQRWKDYLSEQFGVIMRSRAEKSALEFMQELCAGDENKSVKYLRYAMANRYKNFFAVEDKDSKEPPKEEVGTGSAFG